MKNNQSKQSQVNSALWTPMSEQQQQNVSGGYWRRKHSKHNKHNKHSKY